MICFEIHINGQKVCIAGVGDNGVLSAMVNHRVSDDSLRTFFDVGGITKPDAETSQRIEWVERELNVGDVIKVKVIEAESYDLRPNQQVTYLQCSFCMKKEAEVLSLIAGANIYICNECVLSCFQVIEKGATIGDIALFDNEASCAFCNKQSSEVAKIVGLADKRICNECIHVCKAIVEVKSSGK